MSDTPRFLLPLTDLLPREAWPEDRLASAGGMGNLFDLVFHTGFEFSGDSDYLSLKLGLALLAGLEVPLPLLSGTALVIGGGGTGEDGEDDLAELTLSFELGWPPVEPPPDHRDEPPEEPDAETPPPPPPPEPVSSSAPPPWRVRADLDLLSIRFSRDLLIPVQVDEAEDVVTPLEGAVHIDFGCRVEVDSEGRVDFALGSGGGGGGTVTLAVSHPFWVGSSRIVVTVGELALRFSSEAPLPAWSPQDLGTGVYLSQLSLRLPEELGVPLLETVGVRNLVLGSSGFSGIIEATWSQRLTSDTPVSFEPGPGVGDLFSMPFALGRLDFELRQNTFVRAGLECDFIPPVIARPLGLLLSVGADGTFTAEVRASTLPGAGDSGGEGPGLVRLRQEGLLELTVRSVSFELARDVATLAMAGQLKPLIAGMDWPALDIQKLSVNSRGEVDLEGGWIEVPESFTLDFHGFKVDIDRVGLGTEGEGAEARQWVGLTGGIQLVEGIPLSASVEGLKVSWRQSGPPDVRVALEGIAVHLEIPQTLVLDGSVRYRELPYPPVEPPEEQGASALGGVFGHIFTGSVRLALTCLNMEVGAELLIGELTRYHYEGGALVVGESFVSLFVVLSVELPSALPLGATGAGLYGLKGLFGMHVAPDRHLDDAGELEPWYRWYKEDRGDGSDYSVTKVVKWGPRFDHYAFGAGLTLGTVFDDGFSLSLGALAAVLIPGPVVMIEGRANLLKRRSGNGQGAEGALYALLVFDGLAETFQMNVDINFTLEDVVTVGGGLEAFFDFNDGSRWFIHVGKKTPEDKRIRAEVLSLVMARAYFMVEPNGIQFGAAAGIDLQLEYGPVEVRFILRLAFELGIFWKEPQLTGMIELYGELSIRIFGIGLGILLQTLLEGSAPRPYWLHGLMRVALSLPFPLPSFDLKAEVSWGGDGEPDLVTLVKGASMVHPKLPGASWALADAVATPDTAAWPLVPVDAVPVLSCGKPLSDVSRVKDGDSVAWFLHETVEGLELRYELREVVLEELTSPGTWTPKLTRTPPGVADLRLRPDLYAQEPQVELWWYAPLDTSDAQSRRNHVEPCPVPTEPERHCVNWKAAPVGKVYPAVFRHQGLAFSVGLGEWALVKSVAGDPDRGLEVEVVVVRFPEPVSWVEVRSQQWGLSCQGFRDGRAVTVATAPAVGVPYLPLGNGSPALSIDTLHVRAAPGSTQQGVPVLTSLCYVTQRELASRRRTVPPVDSTALRTAPVLQPHKTYRLRVKAARVRRSVGETATTVAYQDLTFGFRTGGLPGTDYARALEAGLVPKAPDFAEGPLNRVESYVSRTVPRHGARHAYRGYDALVELADPYAAAMFGGVLEVSVVDRNGKAAGPVPAFQLLSGEWPFLTPGLLALLGAPREAACAETPVSWSPRYLPRYVACALPPQVRPGRMYRVEMSARLPYGLQPVHGFEFAVSRFLDAREHLASGLRDGVQLPDGTMRGTRPLRRPLAPVAVPRMDWVALLQAREAALAGLRQTLAAALTVGPADAGMGVEEARAQVAAALEARQALGAAVYAWLDGGGALRLGDWGGGAVTLTYEGVQGRFAEAGLGQRQLPSRALEVLALQAASGGCFLLLESPEPLDWARLSVLRADLGTPLSVVPCGDGTRAFLFDSSPGGLFVAGSGYTLLARWNTGGTDMADLDPLYRQGVLAPPEEVLWECTMP